MNPENFKNKAIEDEITADNPNPLPRSVVRRMPFKLLDGEWRFALDADNRGIDERWFIHHDFTEKANFPGSIESHLEAAKGVKEEVSLYKTSDEVIAWYEREFIIPESWNQDDKTLTQLTFGACGYETRVWLNGFPLKTIEGELEHLGEYNSFSYELPPERLLAKNRLTIRVADTLSAEIPRGKQASRVYKQGGIWYQTISGAVRSIWIECVGRNRLRTRVNVISSLRDQLVEFDLTLRTHDPGAYKVRLTVTPQDLKKRNEQNSITSEFEMLLETGEKVQRFPVAVANAQVWSPQRPYLYNLKAELYNTDNYVTGIETHFGLRKVSARGKYIYLNHEPVYLDGILYQPGISTYEEIRRHLLAIKKLGCNLARIHIAGIDPRLYDLADEIGLMLWVEVPSPHSSTQTSRQNHWAELQRMLVFVAAHPSIVILSLYNEDWGVEDIRSSIETRRYITETFEYMRINYPQLLIVDNDGWNHISKNGRLTSNLLTAHIYTPDNNVWTSSLDRLTAGELSGITAQPLIIGDPYFYQGQAPLVISEWGGFGFVNYGGPSETEGKWQRIKLFKQEMRRRAIAGDIYTQATSIEDELNGIIEPKTGELLVPEGLLRSSED